MVFGFTFADPRGEEDVFEGSELGEEEVMLENKAHAAVAQGGTIAGVGVIEGFAMDEDISRGGAFEAAENVKEGGFAGAGGAAKEDFLTCIHLQIDSTEHVQVMTSEVIAPMDIPGLEGVSVGGGHEEAGTAGDNDSEGEEVQWMTKSEEKTEN